MLYKRYFIGKNINTFIDIFFIVCFTSYHIDRYLLCVNISDVSIFVKKNTAGLDKSGVRTPGTTIKRCWATKFSKKYF